MKMKTLLAVMMSLALAAGTMAACGNEDNAGGTAAVAETDVGADEETNLYEGLTFYESESGISLYMAEGFTEDSIEGSACCFKGTSSAVTCKEELFSALEQIGYSGEMAEAEYAELIIEAYQLDSEVETDEYGNVSFVYLREVMGAQMYYYAFVDKGSEAYWTTTFMCGSDAAEEMEADFRHWASSIQIP